MSLFKDVVNEVFHGISRISSVERKSVRIEDAVVPKRLKKGCSSGLRIENSLNLRKMLESM